MVNKTVLILIILLTISFAKSDILNPIQIDSKIGDKIELPTKINKDGFSYNEYRDKIIVGFKPSYKFNYYQTTSCDWYIDSKTLKNTTFKCYNKTHSYKQIDTKTKGDPIYKLTPINKIIRDKKIYDYSEYNAVECSGKRGTFLLRVLRNDGGQFLETVRKEKLCDKTGYPIIPDGSDDWEIYDLKNNIMVGKATNEYYKT